jgi:hypothetical protein
MCGEVFSDEMHYRFWIYWYQLWLIERATIGATLAALGEGERYATFARDILLRYAEQYASYPNQDNVLGPTRLFFSTYLESIWLLQVCIALDLLELSGEQTAGDVVRDRIVEPSAAIIAGYDERSSNRQVWNDAAMLAAARMLRTDSRIDEIVYGSSGIASHLAAGLLPDGSWYEGENYHLFAHRGLWYGLAMAERAGAELPDPLVARFDAGFMIPFATALPDMTMPSRRDSQYAISLRQWRIAEHCELGAARTRNAALIGALARLYSSDVSRRDTGRWRSSADVERNEPASALSRSDVSWRALLHALPELPALDADTPRSVLLEGQGIAVFRRDDGRAYAALDYGHSGGDHGHPDRLNLLLVDDNTRWLDDMGTGSYVDPSLHWYRSTLAHNAPLLNGQSQARVHGRLLAYDERGAAGWISASVEEVAPGASVARTLVVMPGYLIDEVEWRADRSVKVDLPFHVDAQVVRGAAELHDDHPSGSTALEDGFRFLESAGMQRSEPGSLVELRAEDADRDALRIWWRSDTRAEWWRAKAPGSPGHAEAFFRFVRTKGDHGVHRSVWSWTGDVAEVEIADNVMVTMNDGTMHTHSRTESGWHVELHAGSSRSSIDLGGLVADDTDVPVMTVASERATSARPVVLTVGSRHLVDLGEMNYRRSEESWSEAGQPSGSVAVIWTGSALRILITVHESDLTFVPAGAVNPHDNEPMDINGDGVQLYLRDNERRSGWLLAPELGGTSVRIRPIEGWLDQRPIGASWRRTQTGYSMDVEVPIDAAPAVESARGSTGVRDAIDVALDVVINERPVGRERRRGQLVMSGAPNEFVYLRGDRHEPWRLVPFTLTNA